MHKYGVTKILIHLIGKDMTCFVCVFTSLKLKIRLNNSNKTKC